MQKLKGNVGRRTHRHCRNYIGDQITIITLLNRIPEQFGGTGGKLQIKPVAGVCPDELYNAIIRFQEANVGSIKPDGKVEAGGVTLLFLNRIAEISAPITTIDAAAMQKLTDTRIQTYQERWQTNPQEYQRMQQREQQAELKKWHAWKERLRQQGRGNLNARLAVDYLDDIERRLSKPSINGWAIGFGEAYIGYDYNSDWQHLVMWGEMIATSYDKRRILINNYGLKGHSPVILFANQTHYILRTNEVVELNEETFKILNK